MIKAFFLSVFILSLSVGYGQTPLDNVSSGRALRFDGIDDYIDLGNIYDDLTLPFSISAWINLSISATGTSPIFVSQDNAPIYNGFWFCITPTHLFIEYGDGLGENNSVYRRGKTAPISNLRGSWVHVAAVVKSTNDMRLYVNGVDVGGSYTGNSILPMASNFPQDVAKIGYFFTNGQIFRFNGLIDEIRVWNREISQLEVRTTMCKKISGNESGLIGYWTFDELAGNTIIDKSSKGFNGQLMNAPTRVYSGAPIGDESVFEYQASWTGRDIAMVHNAETVTVNNILGNPQGVHLYVVNKSPSQTNGINSESIPQMYFGAFMASLSNGTTFNILFESDGGCASFTRADNSVINWISRDALVQNVANRIEIIKGTSEASIEVNLGEDEALCPFVPKLLIPVDNPSGLEFTWSNGSKNSSLVATNFGKYWVEITDGCSTFTDTVNFTKAQYSLDLSLGEDETVCPLTSRVLSPLTNPSGYEFTWQDGSKQSTFMVTDYGKYWVTVQSECFQASDTIEISKLDVVDFFIPNVITPNDDPLNQYFIVDNQLIGSRLIILNRWGKTVYETPSYQNNWDGSGLPTGVYYYLIFGECIEQKKGWISIVR